MRRKTSILSDKKIFSGAVRKSETIGGVLSLLGLRSAGGNYRAIKEYARIHGIKLPDGAKIRNEKLRMVGKRLIKPLQEILVENSSYNNRYSLKKRLLEAGLLKNHCYFCGLKSVWNGKPLSLQLEHSNGVFDDNRLSNLKLLCPNCHSQTKTFGGGNRTRSRFKKRKMTDFQKKYRIEKSRRFRLSKKELMRVVWEKPTEVIGREHGVSGKCVEKYCKKWGIHKPPRGYWAKVKNGKSTRGMLLKINKFSNC